MKLDGKVALITGSGGMLGRATALLFAKEGADIAVNDIDLAAAEETAKKVRELGRKAVVIKADITQTNEVDAMVDKVIKELGGIHILVNNTGIAGELSPTVDSSIEHWDKVIGINLRGTYLCSRRVGKWMVSHKTGAIVNIGSIVGLCGFPFAPSYGVTKAGIAHMTRSLASEWAKYNIRVNCIAPGFIATPKTGDMTKSGPFSEKDLEKRTPMGRLGKPEEIAKAALFLVSDDASYVTGAILPVDGGWVAYGYI